MENIIDNIIAGIIVAAIIAGMGLLVRKFWPVWEKTLTQHLLEKVLSVDMNDADKAKVELKKKTIERVLQEASWVKQDTDIGVRRFPNQVACEQLIREAFAKAKSAKILTIRGERYFKGHSNLLLDLCLSKLHNQKDFILELLVLSPQSSHITEELAESLDQDPKEIKMKMYFVLQKLSQLAKAYKNFRVKCFDETPNFKILLFDDVMFVSSYASGKPKNDHNTEMLYMRRDETPLFIGFEKLFDDLWKRSVPLEKVSLAVPSAS